MAGAATVERCPVCEAGESAFFRRIDGYDYLQCASCGSLHIDNATLAAIDGGKSTRLYDVSYWRDELIPARERAQGEALVRAGEAILYARRPVSRFLDIGSGPGYLLDELARQFPRHAGMFHGVELFPPEQHSNHPNYHIGDVGNLLEKFDAGVCIEVIEHLTPAMLSGLVRNLAQVSEPDAVWLFNTGMPELVLQNDPAYLDPIYRGHIVSYSLAGLQHLFEQQGFKLSAIPGKNYLFMAGYGQAAAGTEFKWRERVPVSENMALLQESGLIFRAVMESMRGTLCEEQLLERTQWTFSLQGELARLSRLLDDLQSEHQRMGTWAQSLDAELAQLRQSHAVLQAVHDRMVHSRSWKLTRPLRGVANWWREDRHEWH